MKISKKWLLKIKYFSRRKLRPSPLEISTNSTNEEHAEEIEETVGGNAQLLLSWARECTKYSSMVNVTNLTSSFRSGAIN